MIDGTTPARDSRGRIFAAAIGQPSIVVFDSLGRYVTAFGRAGEGPGELGTPLGVTNGPWIGSIRRIVVGSGDTLYIFRDPARIEVFSPALEFVRRAVEPITDRGSFGGAVVLPGGFAIATHLQTPESIGLNLHVLGRDGRLVRSFAGSDGPIIGTAPAAPNGLPSVAAAPDGSSLWTVADSGFVLEQWSLAGERRAVITLTDVPWMHPLVYYDTTLRSGRGERRVRRLRPHAQLTMERVDPDGRIWVESYVPGGGEPRGGHPTSLALEVVDSRSGKLITSQPLPTGYAHMGGGYFASISGDANDVVSFVIWRAVLRVQ